jgi:hypothetical protein
MNTHTQQAPATQLKQEIVNVLRRYSQESDVTICQALGVLEIVKAEMIQEMLTPDDDQAAE